MRTLAAILWIPALAAGLIAQELPDIEDQAQSEEYAEFLDYLEANPVNLNQATLEELMLLPSLTPAQLLAMDRYLRRHPQLSNPVRLVSDSVIDQSAFEAILPYISIQGPTPAGNSAVLRSVWQRRWSPSCATDLEAYSPWRNRQTLRAEAGPLWTAAMQSQKDAGEADWADFMSGGIQYRDRSSGIKAVAGDYRIGFGQGLAFGATYPSILYPGYGTGNGASGLALYTSSNEAFALRGMAAEARFLDRFSIAGFVSQRPLDARISPFGEVDYFYLDGYHRSQPEAFRKNNTRERIGGLRLGCDLWDAAGLGILGYVINHKPGLAESLSYQGGVSADLGIRSGPAFLQIEATANDRKQGAACATMGTGTARAETWLAVYYYSRDYRAPRANSYQHYGGRDEAGAALGSSLRLPLRSKLDLLWHHFRPASVPALVDKGHGGFLLDFILTNGIIKNFETRCRFRVREDEKLTGTGNSSDWDLHRNVLARAALDWQATEDIKASVDAAMTRDEPAGGGDRGRGDLLSAGLSWKIAGGTWLQCQSTVFSSSSYQARLYQPEPELRSTGSFHPLMGAGRRDVASVRYAIIDHILFEIKAALETRRYEGERSRSSEIGIQIDVKL